MEENPSSNKLQNYFTHAAQSCNHTDRDRGTETHTSERNTNTCHPLDSRRLPGRRCGAASPSCRRRTRCSGCTHGCRRGTSDPPSHLHARRYLARAPTSAPSFYAPQVCRGNSPRISPRSRSGCMRPDPCVKNLCPAPPPPPPLRYPTHASCSCSVCCSATASCCCYGNHGVVQGSSRVSRGVRKPHIRPCGQGCSR